MTDNVVWGTDFKAGKQSAPDVEIPLYGGINRSAGVWVSDFLGSPVVCEASGPTIYSRPPPADDCA